MLLYINGLFILADRMKRRETEMKRSKRLMGLFLAALMVLSCMSASFVAFAAEGDAQPTAVEAFETKLTEFLGINANLAAARPDEEKYPDRAANYDNALALYNELCPMYKALTDAEKDAVDIYSALRFLQIGVNKEAYEIRTAYNADKPKEEQMSTNESKVKGQEKLFELIGPHAARDEALEAAKMLWEPVGKRMIGTTESDAYISTSLDYADYQPKATQVLNQFIEDYRNASPMARRYMDGVDPNSGTYGLSGIGRRLIDAVKMIVKEQMTAGEKENRSQSSKH